LREAFLACLLRCHLLAKGECPPLGRTGRELRDRTLRAAFDALTTGSGERLSKAQAIYELCQQYKLTSRQLECIVDQPDAEAEAAQGVLF
jgi:hypothetical protein